MENATSAAAAIGAEHSVVHWSGIYLQRKLGERGIPALTPLHQRHSAQKTSRTLDSQLLISPVPYGAEWKKERRRWREERMERRGRTEIKAKRSALLSHAGRQAGSGVGSRACMATLPGPPLPDSHVSMATCGPCLRPGESGSDGGDLYAFRLAHYVGNEVKQPGGAFVLRGLPLSCQASVYL